MTLNTVSAEHAKCERDILAVPRHFVRDEAPPKGPTRRVSALTRSLKLAARLVITDV